MANAIQNLLMRIGTAIKNALEDTPILWLQSGNTVMIKPL